MGNKTIDFSVVICCYNPDFEKLKKTIISIVNQKGVSFEIIITDDGSKENYLPKLKSWVDENNITNTKFNFLKENVGTVKNLISGMRQAVGKYIKVISPGDYLFDENSLQRYKHEFETENADVIFARGAYYNEEGKIFNFTNPYLRSSAKSKNLKRNVCYFRDSLLGATMACRKEMIKYFHEIDGVVKYLEDYPFSYLTLMNGENVRIINDCLVWYEYGIGISTSSDSSPRLKKDYESFYNFLKEKYSCNTEISKSLKCFKLLNDYDGKNTIFKMALLKPSYLFIRMGQKLFGNYKVKQELNIEDMKKITSLKQ